MDTVGITELRQHASALLRRVRRGETIHITDRGKLVAVLCSPSAATGTAALMAAERVTPALSTQDPLPEAVTATSTIAETLDDLRSER